MGKRVYIYIDELLLRAGELHGVGDEQPASQIWGTRVIRVWEGIGECVAWAEMIGTERERGGVYTLYIFALAVGSALKEFLSCSFLFGGEGEGGGVPPLDGGAIHEQVGKRPLFGVGGEQGAQLLLNLPSELAHPL